MAYKTSILDYMSEFTNNLGQTLSDLEMGPWMAWKEKGVDKQEERIYAILKQYENEHKIKGKPIPWFMISALAYLAWVRETNDVTDPVIPGG